MLVDWRNHAEVAILLSSLLSERSTSKFSALRWMYSKHWKRGLQSFVSTYRKYETANTMSSSEDWGCSLVENRLKEWRTKIGKGATTGPRQQQPNNDTETKITH